VLTAGYENQHPLHRFISPEKSPQKRTLSFPRPHAAFVPIKGIAFALPFGYTFNLLPAVNRGETPF
jgi:hypothetical protein